MGVIRSMAKEIGHEARRKTGCAALPRIMDFAGKNVERELSSRTREFYEFVMPPVDMQGGEGTVTVSVDVPGYRRDQIKIRIDGNVLSVRASRDPPEDAIYAQRPNTVRKDIRIPARIKRGEEPECPASLQDGVLRVTVPVPQSGRDVAIGQ